MVTLNELGRTATGLTMARPTRYTPGGPLWHTGLLSSLGALAGYAAAPTVGGWVAPYADPERLKLVGSLIGGAGGFLASMPNMIIDPNGFGDFSRYGRNATTIARGGDTMYAKGASCKTAYTVSTPGWNAPFISNPAFTLSVDEALRRGDITPTEAVIAKNTMQGADNGQGRTSPQQVQKSFAGMLINAGVGAMHGFALGRLAGAVMGSFGLLSAEQSHNIVPYAAATAGALTTLARTGF